MVHEEKTKKEKTFQEDWFFFFPHLVDNGRNNLKLARLKITWCVLIQTEKEIFSFFIKEKRKKLCSKKFFETRKIQAMIFFKIKNIIVDWQILQLTWVFRGIQQSCQIGCFDPKFLKSVFFFFFRELIWCLWLLLAFIFILFNFFT